MEIKKYPNPILNRKSAEVKKIDSEIKTLAKEMVLLMEKEKGVGLAAAQVGILKKIVVIETGKGSAVFINPKIVKKSRETFVDLEGCLSFPGLWVKIRRSKKITVEALNLDGEKIKIEAEWMAARVLQHEIDHLDGKLLISRMNLVQRWKFRDKLAKLKKEYAYR